MLFRSRRMIEGGDQHKEVSELIKSLVLMDQSHKDTSHCDYGLNENAYCIRRENKFSNMKREDLVRILGHLKKVKGRLGSSGEVDPPI